METTVNTDKSENEELNLEVENTPTLQDSVEELTLGTLKKLLIKIKKNITDKDVNDIFNILKNNWATTKVGISKFSTEDWNYIGLPIGVRNILKEWASPQAQDSSQAQRQKRESPFLTALLEGVETPTKALRQAISSLRLENHIQDAYIESLLGPKQCTWTTSEPVTRNHWRIPPEDIMLPSLLEIAKAGTATIVHAHFRAGKTTHAHALKVALAVHDIDALFIYFRNWNKHTTSAEMWARICSDMKTSHQHFKDFKTQQGFLDCFSKYHEKYGKRSFVLLIDEMQTILELSPDVRGDFLHGIRILMNAKNVYTYKNIIGFGTFNLTNLSVQRTKGGNVVSPFNVNNIIHLRLGNNYAELISRLIYTWVTSLRNVTLAPEIVADICNLCSRHCGLVSYCGKLLDTLVTEERNQASKQEYKISFIRWKASTVILPQQMKLSGEFGQPINMIKADPKLQECLKRHFLFDDTPVQCIVDETEAEEFGILQDIGIIESVGEFMYDWTAPLLRDVVVQTLTTKTNIVTNIITDVNGNLDMIAILRAAISKFDLNAILSRETSTATGRPSEYIFQAELFAVLRGMFYGTAYKVVTEAKYRKIKDERRLDIYIKNGTCYTIEIKSGLTNIAQMVSAVNQALDYGELFDATESFLLHFTTVNARLADKEEFPPVISTRSLTIVHVIYSQDYQPSPSLHYQQMKFCNNSKN